MPAARGNSRLCWEAQTEKDPHFSHLQLRLTAAAINNNCYCCPIILAKLWSNKIRSNLAQGINKQITQVDCDFKVFRKSLFYFVDSKCMQQHTTVL